MGKRAVISVSEHKEVCIYTDHFPVTSQQNMANHISWSWDTAISCCHTGDILKEKTKWENLASANIKKMKGAKHKKQEEALAIWMGLLNAENGTATDETVVAVF